MKGVPNRRGRKPEERLQRRVYAILERFIGTDRPSPLGRILAHEAMDPTGNLESLIGDTMRPEVERIHALLGDAAMAQTPAYHALVSQQAAFLERYRAGRFGEALEMIESCQLAADQTTWRQGYYTVMRARIKGLADDPPADWTGVYVAQEK